MAARIYFTFFSLYYFCRMLSPAQLLDVFVEHLSERAKACSFWWWTSDLQFTGRMVRKIYSFSLTAKQTNKQPQLIIYCLYETWTGYFLNVNRMKSTALSSGNYENTWRDYKQCYIGILQLMFINVKLYNRAAFQNIICQVSWLKGNMQSYSRIVGKDRRQHWTEGITL